LISSGGENVPRNDETRSGDERVSPQFTSVAGYQGEPAKRIVLNDAHPVHRPEG
jgi:hypothetical protein